MTAYYGPNKPLIEQVVRTELEELAWNDQVAGETLAQYDVVFRDGNFWKGADASVVNEARPPLGMSQDAAASGIAADIWFRAIVSNGSWAFTSGGRVFLASGGGPTMSSPPNSGDISVVLGIAITPTAMEFHPQRPIRLAQ